MMIHQTCHFKKECISNIVKDFGYIFYYYSLLSKLITIFDFMNDKDIKPLKIDRTKLITQSKYAQKNGLSKQNVYAMIKAGKIPTIEIDGATLVLLQ